MSFLNFHTSQSTYTFASDATNGQCLVINRQDGSFRTASRTSLQIQSESSPQRVFGIMGISQLKLDRYLLVITGRRSVGRIGRDDVFEATKVELFPMRFKSFAQIKDTEELEYVALLKAHLKTGPFYFSHTMDLTNTLQRQTTNTSTHHADPLWARADERFFWNRYLMSDLIDYRTRTHDTNIDSFILPITYGFLEIRQTALKGKPMTFVLISRRSRHRAGTRYFTRGIDAQGNVSNFNETEQLVLMDSTGKSSIVDGQIKISYVQTRGSVPAYWAEVNDLKYKPRLRVFSQKDAAIAARLHFDQQLKFYGDQYCVNLVNQKGHELPVKKAFEDVVRQLNDREIHYVYFDFHHECKGMRWDRVQILIDQLEDGLIKQGYCHVDSTKSDSIVAKQSSVVRTNCMDCLDRTNVVQSALARWMLTRQMRALGILGPLETTAQFEKFEFMFRNVWADNANTVSMSYSGTGALKTDFTRTGKRSKEGAASDGWNSIVRYLRNNYGDGPRQDAYDLFLGVYRPAENHDSPFGDFRPVFVQSVPYIAWSAFLMIVAAGILPRSSNAWGSMKVFVVFWAAVLGWSLQYLLAHGLWYVNWPKLNVPEFLSTEKGSEGINVRHGSLGQKNGGSMFRDMEAGKTKARRD
ncbi:putative Phosphoinositide phosphatase [Taphrina deformans PYCC 5710]|uniref:Phosphoinositide phosphatase n=1 Tax=Taphrina deformans (strain PYCC 5710 / ATCC 11124 / CBS 356.35 / IMI 108563 / JCM 9778 / NBRC 8474) TaxID=1097556 RepID=R4XES2_TAPDE|nr:putative Phosphoinositide phosphatase [Taphrina deformans PYCC 5710]|eukprot:CCG81867.1 putative Phosphoinositide phosphatase [Taphrina deformans PYCC 5710]